MLPKFQINSSTFSRQIKRTRGYTTTCAAEIEEEWAHDRLRGKCLKISFYSEWEITLLGKEYHGKIKLLMACSREGFKCQSNRKFRKTKSSILFSCSTHCLG